MVICVCTACKTLCLLLLLHHPLSCSPILCFLKLSSFFALLLCSAHSLLSLPHSVAGAAVMSVPQGEIHITPSCRTAHYTRLHVLEHQLLGGKALPYCMGPQRLDVCLQVWAGARRDKGSGETDRQVDLNGLPSPPLPRPVNIRRSTEVGRTVIVFIIIWLKCYQTLYSYSHDVVYWQ